MRHSVKLALMLGIVLAVGLGGWLLASRGLERARAAPEIGKSMPGEQNPVPVFATAAEARDVPIILRGVGSVAAYNTVSVKSRTDGNIVKVAYKEGQFVHAGDLLIELDPRPLQAALDQAIANQAKDQANLDNAQRDLARDAALIKDQLAITQQQYDTQKALVASDQAIVASDKAQVEAARVNLDFAQIRSPIDGRTGQRQVDIGNLVQAGAGTTLVVVTQMQPIYVGFSVAGRDLARIREELARHPLTVAAFDGDDKKQIAEGRLTLINNQVDPTTGMVGLRATFANDKEALWPGEFVNAHLILDTVKGGVTIPAGAVQMGPKGAFAYAVKDDSTVETRPLTVTQIEANTALIGEGLKAGDKVVTSGQNRLFPGVKVAVQQGEPGQMNASQPEIGPQGVGSTGVNTPVPGGTGLSPR